MLKLFNFLFIEKKLLKYQPISKSNLKESNDRVAKDFLKSLNMKKSTLFDLEHDIDVHNEEDIPSSQHPMFSNNAIINTLERKFFPQHQAINIEELNKLIKSDLLNAIYSANLSEDNEETKSNHETK